MLQAIRHVRRWTRHGMELENRGAPKVRPQQAQSIRAHYCRGGAVGIFAHPLAGGGRRVRRHNEVSGGLPRGCVP
jgi:hypothetical protein